MSITASPAQRAHLDKMKDRVRDARAQRKASQDRLNAARAASDFDAQVLAEAELDNATTELGICRRAPRAGSSPDGRHRA